MCKVGFNSDIPKERTEEIKKYVKSKIVQIGDKREAEISDNEIKSFVRTDMKWRAVDLYLNWQKGLDPNADAQFLKNIKDILKV